MTEEHDSGEWVELTRARSPFEAKVIAGVLANENIPAYVPGGALQDDWAMAQRMMNSLEVKVLVPPSQLDAARTALAAAKAAGAELDPAADASESTDAPARKGCLPVVLLGAIGTLTALLALVAA